MENRNRSSSDQSARRSIPGLLVGIVIRPSPALTSIRDNPRWVWVAPAVLAIAIILIQALVMTPIASQQAAELMEEQLANLPEEQRAQLPPTFAQGPSIALMATTTIVGGLVGLAVGWLFQAGVVHLGSLALGGQNSFSQVFSMVAWVWLPNFFRSLTQVIYTAITGELITHPGLSSLVATGNQSQDASNLVYALLTRIDIFVGWHLALLFIGVAVVARFSKRKALLVTLGYWLLATGLSLIPFLVGRAFLSQFPGPTPRPSPPS